MRAQVNNLVLFFRVPVNCGVNVQKSFTTFGRRLHGDGSIAYAAKVVPEPTAEARAPLTDLLGRRHNYLRISLTERCNLRCQYCMPAEGVPLSPRQALLSRGELTRAVHTFAALGVTKVRLTGGEPTLRPDLADIIQDIKSIEGIDSIAMTTNGLVLTRKLPALQRAGLAALNVSLDSLQPDRYEHMSRRPGLKKVLAGIDLALQLGYKPVKINVVLMKGFNDDEICDFVEYTRDREVEVRFIEFMPFSGNAWDDSKLVPHKVAVKALMERYPDALPCLPRANDTARVWQVPGFTGRLGFISSMTKNFCSTCNRLRLTADGNLKVCLFGAAEVSLRNAMREGATDEQLELLIRTALRNKKPQHAESRAHGEPPYDSDRRLAYSLFTYRRIAAREPPLAATPRDKLFGVYGRLVPRATTLSALQKKSTQKSPLKDTATLTSNFSIPSARLVPKASNIALRAKSTQLKNTATIIHSPSITSARLVPKASNIALRAKSTQLKNTSTLISSLSIPSGLLVPKLSPHTGLRAFSSNVNFFVPFTLLVPKSSSHIALKSFSSTVDSDLNFSHLDSSGKARMVDVGEKEITSRIAEAQCALKVGGRLLRLLRDARLPKGDALTVAQIAGVVGAKKTSELIPMCHPLPLDCVRIKIHLPKGENSDGGDIMVHCEVRCMARTGAEMEALIGAATAGLALYDMCKSVDKHMTLTNLRVVHKSGGRSGTWPRKNDKQSEVKVRDYDTSPIKPNEGLGFIPNNIGKF